MSDMKDREKGFERKFAFDEELRFKATARRNKLLGLWAAEKLGKSGADADAYAKEVVVSDIEEAGDHDVFRKVKSRFRRRRRRAVRSSDPPHDGRTDGRGHRAGQGQLRPESLDQQTARFPGGFSLHFQLLRPEIGENRGEEAHVAGITAGGR